MEEIRENAELIACQTELATCREKAAKVEDQLLRVRADFENFRRNAEKERLNVGHIAQCAVFRDLLPLVDNFERALESFKKAETLSAVEAAQQQGIEILHRELQRLLEKYEVIVIDASGMFNPEVHEALMRVASADVPSGNIVAVLQKGYRCRETVLRPAQVSVAE